MALIDSAVSDATAGKPRKDKKKDKKRALPTGLPTFRAHDRVSI
jgi:hypothetical protein